MKKFDIVVVGSGVAGASTAYFLKKKYGVNNLIVLEKEKTPFSHASGLNAGIVRLLVETKPIAELAKKSLQFFENPPTEFTQPFFSQNGGILTQKDTNDERLDLYLRIARQLGIIYDEVKRKEVLDKIPFLEDAPFIRAVFGKKDGVLDGHTLLSQFLNGIEVLTSCEASKFVIEGNKIKSIHLPDGEICFDLLVMATGAYSEEVARILGLKHIYLDTRRRHLLVSTKIEGIDKNMPYYWAFNPQFYFRYESGGLLFSPCDEIAVNPNSLQPTAESLTWLYERLKIGAPRLTEIKIKKYWAEIRTFSYDNNFIIGFDPILHNLFWVTALQGHGMTCSAGIGETASDLICQQKPEVDFKPHLPSRFIA